LYTGNKRVTNGDRELANIIDDINYIIITQGLDDHAHTPTLKKISKLKPNMQYVCPPSAVQIFEKCGISQEKLIQITPGQQITIKNKKNDAVEIRATTGAKVGPPWQANENGYLLRPKPKQSTSSKYSLYIEPHCMYENEELEKYTSDIVISPIKSQKIFTYTLVDGGNKAASLCDTLDAKFLVPMANGDLVQTGLLSNIINAKGTVEDMQQIRNNRKKSWEIVKVQPGKQFSLL
jgi:L-ascorbate metabolism protein UlaG (beta-lactamase superfamily)